MGEYTAFYNAGICSQKRGPQGLTNSAVGQTEPFLHCLHASGTVDAQNLAVDPFAILRGEEANDTSNVDRETDTVERRPASGVLKTKLAQLLVSR